jgi:cell division protein FtsL
MRKENKGQKFTRSELIKKFLFAFIFSLVLVVAVYLIFTKLMFATLP